MAAICRSTIIKEGTPFTSEWTLRSLQNGHAVYIGMGTPLISEWLRRSAGICSVRQNSLINIKIRDVDFDNSVVYSYSFSLFLLEDVWFKFKVVPHLFVVLQCRVKILYVAPERLETGILSWIEEYSQIKIIAVDECHCVTTWGSTFRDAYRSIGEYIDSLDHDPAIVALSATVFPEDRPRIMKLLSMRSVKEFAVSLYRSNLSLMKKNVASGYGHLSGLKKCLKKYHRHTTIVFCNTKAAAENVAKELKKIYRSEVMAYHSRCKEQEQDMLSGKKHIIVATSALSMGVDIRDVDLVIHYNMPIHSSTANGLMYIGNPPSVFRRPPKILCNRQSSPV